MKINNYIWENDLSLNDLVLKQKEEIERLNKARKTDIEYNKYLQKEIIRLNNIKKEAIKYILGNDLDNFDNINNLLNILKGSESNEHI